YGDQLRIVFKHFPIEKSCNSSVAMTLHPGACEAAHGMEAARRQGQFWAYHEALAETRYRDRPDGHLAAAAAIRLDMDRFRADLADPSTRDRIVRDVELGIRLGIDGTPGFILDGRRITDSRPQSVRLLLDHLIARKKHSARQGKPRGHEGAATAGGRRGAG